MAYPSVSEHTPTARANRACHPPVSSPGPPYPDFELFKLATFFFFRKKMFRKKKILEKNFLEKKFSPADAAASFRPKKPKSAIKNVSPAPLSTPLRRFFMTPPSKKFYDPPLAPKSLHTYAVNWSWSEC